jgi:ATP-binding cassette subfamily C protein CydC
VRAFAAEDRMLAAVQGREAVLLSAQHALVRRTGVAGALAFLCGQAAVLCVLLDAGVHPQGAVAAAFLLVAAFELVGGLPRAGALAGHAVAAARRVVEAATAPAAVAEPAQPLPMPAGSALRFEAVRFRWQPDRDEVFEAMTLDVPQGARVALLGPSGAGKSTVAALALKLVAPQSGRILLGGVDIADLSSDDVRRRIGWLSQTTHLFYDTIRANLLLARPDADDAALWQALDAARIGEFVRALPDQLDTWVGEGGTRFSGGQGRRLALARTLLSPAQVLILDEPCAGLDAATERAFLATLNEVADGRSIVLIAHRLIGVERLDRIWRLSSGKAIAAAA